MDNRRLPIRYFRCMVCGLQWLRKLNYLPPGFEHWTILPIICGDCANDIVSEERIGKGPDTPQTYRGSVDEEAN